MKICNKRVRYQFKFIYLIILFVFILNIIDDSITGKFGNSIGDEIVGLIFFITSFLLIWRGFPLFKFDSNGEVLIVKSSEPVLISKLSDYHFFAEFPKAKLTGFKVKKILFKKTLYMYIQGSGRRKTLRVSISYLNNKEVSLLNQSLKNVLRNNKKEVVNEQRPVRGRVVFG